MSHKIIVVVEGGVVQVVCDIPPGIEVEVRDFDIEGAALEDLTIINDEGDTAYVTVYNSAIRKCEDYVL